MRRQEPVTHRPLRAESPNSPHANGQNGLRLISPEALFRHVCRSRSVAAWKIWANQPVEIHSLLSLFDLGLNLIGDGNVPNLRRDRRATGPWSMHCGTPIATSPLSSGDAVLLSDRPARIAVVGAGPLGLAVADELTRLNHAPVRLKIDSHLSSMVAWLGLNSQGSSLSISNTSRISVIRPSFNWWPSWA